MSDLSPYVWLQPAGLIWFLLLLYVADVV